MVSLKTIYKKKDVRATRGLEYMGRKEELGMWTPVFDSTDHFAFVCKKCREILDIIFVKQDQRVSSPTLYFYMHCDKCNLWGQRKIYLAKDNTKKAFLEFPVQTEMLGMDVAQAPK